MGGWKEFQISLERGVMMSKFKKDNDETIVIMNQATWESFKEELIMNADKRDKPIEYLLKMVDVEIDIDKNLEDGLTEVWSKDAWKLMKDLNNFLGIDEDDS